MNAMSDHERLLEEFLPRILAEFRRISFTEEDLRFLGFRCNPSVASKAAYLAALADLHTVPTGLGAEAFLCSERHRSRRGEARGLRDVT
jgi:hypothetical protein